MIEVAEVVFYFVIAIGLLIAFFFILTMIEMKRNEKKDNKLKNFPAVTFVIPSLNVEKCIRKCINSILRQKYLQDKIKILVVDNGSSDSTLSIIKNFMKKHKNIAILHKKYDGKLSALKTKSLNYGIARVKSELTACLDADTFPMPDALAKAVKALEDKKTMLAMVRLVPTKSNFLTMVQEVEYAFCIFFRKLLSSMNALAVSNAFTVYKTKFFRNYGGFDVGNLTEDYEMALRAQSHHHDVACIIDSYAETDVPITFKALQRQRIRWNYGLIYNMYKYKHLFSLKYGDLGLFSMPSQYVIVLATLIFFIFAVLDIGNSALLFIRHLLVGWRPELNITVFNTALFLSSPKIILYIISIIFSLFFFSLVKKYTKKKINFFYYLFYTFIYIWFILYFYIVTIPYFFIKKPEW